MKVRYALADVPAVYELGFDVTTESIFVSYDKRLGPSREVTKPMIVATKTNGVNQRFIARTPSSKAPQRPADERSFSRGAK